MMVQKTRKLAREISLRTLGAALLFLLSFGAFAVIAHEIVLEKEDAFDTSVFSFFKTRSSPQLIAFFNAVTFFGSSYFIFPAYVLITGMLLLKKKIGAAVNVAALGITSTALLHGLKRIFERKRPDLPLFTSLHNYSFPSGHALSSFILCSILVWLIWNTNWKKWLKITLAILLVLFSLLIGISRIVLRYHYASDVLAGFCLGFGWVLLSFWLLRKLHDRYAEREKRGQQNPLEGATK